MKVLNLRCTHDHGFEGWFSSEDDFQAQNQRGAIECPSCGDNSITRLPSAPRLNISGARAPESISAAAGPPAPVNLPAGPAEALQSMWRQAVKRVLANTEDVGDRFPEEARRIHYGETGHRGIRGQASAQERAELAEEGIEVMALPMPAASKGTTH
jgi:hypothetical protein